MLSNVRPGPLPYAAISIKIPDATPEIITAYAMRYGQALLAEVRYNGLVAMSLGITAFSLWNHLRTTVKEVGQIEIDEIFVGIDGVVQTQRDVMCAEKFPDLICRAVAAQCMSEQCIAMFELTVQNGEISNAAP